METLQAARALVQRARKLLVQDHLRAHAPWSQFPEIRGSGDFMEIFEAARALVQHAR